MWKSMIVAIVCGGSCLLLALPARGQIVRPFDAPRPQNGPRFYATAYPSPPVSPYVNLGINPNGISNYQTLVRPMIDDRVSLQRQSAVLEQLEQGTRGRAVNLQPRDQEQILGRGQQPPPARFLHYSHYFGTR